MIKKIAVGLFLLTVLIIVGFLSIGYFVPHISYSTSVEIAKPLDTTWAYFIDDKNMSEWLPNFKRIETISGAPNTVGSKFKLVFDNNGSEMAMTETNTEFQPKSVFGFVLDHEIMTNNVRVTFSEANGKTTVTQSEHLTGANFLWRSLFPLMKTFMADASKQTLERLKQKIEEQP